MAHRTTSDREFLAAALDLFRTHGFEGVSLTRLGEATGLEKASLYHRYPGGKDEIAMAVVRDVIAWFEKNVFEPLKGSGAPRKRMSIVCEHLRAFYANGAKACITDMLSIPGGTDELHSALRAAMEAWIQAFAAIARESGMTQRTAVTRAEDAIVRFEGSLVVSRVLGNTAPCQRVLRLLPKLLTEARSEPH